MPKPASLVAAVAIAVLLISCAADPAAQPPAPTPEGPGVALPAPDLSGAVTVSELLDGRSSTREYAAGALSAADLASLLWAGYGVQDDGGRTVPSAGARYPMTLYVLVAQVTAIEAGLYRYDPHRHQLDPHAAGDLRADLMRAALDQDPVAAAPAVLVIAGSPDRLRDRYHDRSERFALLEAGHIAQNLALAAQSIDIGLVTIGAFDDDRVRDLLRLPGDEQAYYIVPLGYLADAATV